LLCDPDRVSHIEKIINIFLLALSLVKEDKVFCCKGLDDLVSGWVVSVVINLQLGHLHIFAHSRAYVLGKGDYVGKKATV
jgi:hypothetical protein